MPLGLAAVKAGVTLAPMLAGILRKRKKGLNFNAAVEEYRNRRAKFRTTAEDEAASERTRGKVASSAQVAAEIARRNAKRQAGARGLTGAAAAALESEADAIGATGRETGAMAAADQLYAAGVRNMEMDQAMEDRIFGAKVGQAQFDARRADANDATFWNSMMDLTSATSALWPAGAPPQTDIMRQPDDWAESLPPPDAPPATVTDIPR